MIGSETVQMETRTCPVCAVEVQVPSLVVASAPTPESIKIVHLQQTSGDSRVTKQEIAHSATIFWPVTNTTASFPL